jgi:hypothetical protein
VLRDAQGIDFSQDRSPGSIAIIGLQRKARIRGVRCVQQRTERIDRMHLLGMNEKAVLAGRRYSAEQIVARLAHRHHRDVERRHGVHREQLRPSRGIYVVSRIGFRDGT